MYKRKYKVITSILFLSSFFIFWIGSLVTIVYRSLDILLPGILCSFIFGAVASLIDDDKNMYESNKIANRRKE